MYRQLKLAQLRWVGHVTITSDEGLPKKVFYRKGRKESAHKEAKRNANVTKTPLNESWKQLHRIEQSGVASSTKEPQSLNQRESVKLKESIEEGKQEPRDHHLTRSTQSEFTCSICNQQLRVKIGLHCQQRTHNHT